ncbi:MAG TPA: ASCH domain-containing protein [Candidatus Bathyarchaeia archaeon]
MIKGKKTIELRRGNPRSGEKIIFLNGRNKSAKVRILCFREGKLEEVLNAGNYTKIIPTAENLGEALAFVKKIYPSTEGTFTTYEFKLE